jgi:hypothetical protein
MLINISKIIFKQLLNKSNVFYFCKTFYNSLTQLLKGVNGQKLTNNKVRKLSVLFYEFILLSMQLLRF